MSPARISIVVPCYNAARYIGEALESAFQQQDVTLQVIVVDDGSEDDSMDVVRKGFPAAQIVSTERAGPSAARSRGTALAEHELIQYLDADDLLSAGKLAVQARALASTGADVAYGDWARFTVDGDGNKIIQPPMRRQLTACPEVDLFDGFWCPTAAYLFHRRIIDRTAGWSMTLPVIQDARFVLDCALEGGQFRYCPGIAAYYRVHQSGSVSTRSRTAFLQDCFVNAREVCEWWERRGALDDRRRRAVADACNHVARGIVNLDGKTFESACQLMAKVCPGYVPRASAPFRWAVRSLGYRRAAMVAGRFRPVSARGEARKPAGAGLQ
jgi:glycosyltransferase involved in cell wall biosynthesis